MADSPRIHARRDDGRTKVHVRSRAIESKPIHGARPKTSSDFEQGIPLAALSPHRSR